MKNFALTFDIEKDGWDKSVGFEKREISMPVLDEKINKEDAVSVVLKIKYAGVCGTDKGIWKRSSFKNLICDSLQKQGNTTRILGHEFVGEIIEVGSMVEQLYGGGEINFGKGCLFSGDSHITCGKCYQCGIGQNNVCSNESILGVSVNGVFANYVKIPARNLWPVNENEIMPEIAAIYDPFGNAIHASSAADVRGKTVAVFGCGPIGLFSILLLKNFGASKIIAIDTNNDNLEMAKDLGVHYATLFNNKAGNDGDREVVAKIMELTGGIGVDVAMEMAGPVSALNTALDSVRRGGEVILFGIRDGDFIIPKFSKLITRGITLRGIIGRKIFGTWQVSRFVLSDKPNGIQEKIWKVILKEGRGTIIDFETYDKENFEKAMSENPKVIFKF